VPPARSLAAEVDAARAEIASFRGLTTGRLVVGAIERTVGAVWRAGQRHTPATSAFLALLREHASQPG